MPPFTPPSPAHPDWPYIWPSYAITLVALGLLAVWVAAELRAARRAAAEAKRPEDAP